MDRYGREVGKVWVADPSCKASSCPLTLDANPASLAVGLAGRYRDQARA